MDKPITVSFRWSIKEMLLAQKLHMRHSPQGQKFRMIFAGLGSLLLVLGIASIPPEKFLPGGLFLCVLGVFFLAMPLFTRRAVHKMYSQLPDRELLVTYDITPDRLASRSEVASTEVVWRTISRAYRTPEGFLLYPTERMFHWLPGHGFENETEVERLSQLIKSKVSKYEQLA